MSTALRRRKNQTGRNDAVLVGHGEIGGMPAVVAVFDFTFMGGSMGVAVGEAIIAASRLAVLQEAALIVATASGGARMQEGILSLMQIAAHRDRGRAGQGCRTALHRHPVRPDHRRCDGILRDVGRYPHCRTGSADRVCRCTRD